ncbi:MAG TPA: hypothetical protein VFQ61_11715 [Polyangiaceae bacterium]|nr:hypothetical protein [Polyangiaceae bacterium]
MNFKPLLGTLCLTLLASRSFAQPSPNSTPDLETAKLETAARSANERSANERSATQHAELGRRLAFAGDLDAALLEFQSSYELIPGGPILYDIASVHLARGDYVAAIAFLRQYLDESTAETSGGDNAKLESETQRQLRNRAMRDLEHAQTRVATVRLEGDLTGAELLVDEQSRGESLDSVVLVNPGTRRLLIRKRGFKPVRTVLTLSMGESRLLSVSLQPSASARPNTDSDAPSRTRAVFLPRDQAARSAAPVGSPTNLGLWVSVVATGVAAGATLASSVLTQRASKEYTQASQASPSSPSRISETRGALKRTALVTDMCGALTALGVGATIYFAVTGGREPVDRRGARLWTIRTGPAGLGWQVQGLF